MLILLAALFICYVFYYFSYGRFKRSKSLNGPSVVPFFGNFKDFKESNFQLHLLIDKYYNDQKEKIFSFFHYNKETIVIRDEEIIQNVLVTKAEKFKNRQFFLDLPWPCENMITMIKGGAAHKYIRSLLSTLTTTGSIKKSAHHVFKSADVFVTKANDAAIQGRNFDIESHCSGYIMQILSSLSFSLDNPNQSDLNKSLIKLMKDFTNPPSWIHEIAALPFGEKIIPYIHNAHKKQLLPLIETTLSLVKKRREDANASSFEDILQILLNVQSSNGNDVKLTDEILLAQALVLLTAVQSQTSFTLATVLYNIAKHKHVQEKLLEEIDKISQDRDFPTWEHLTSSDTSYMDQVIQESERMNPAIFALLRECTEACTIDNVEFAVGDTVLVPTYSIHRDKANFDRPEIFDPSRFQSDAKIQHFYPFGKGARQCTGFKLAHVEIKVLLAKLLSRFSLELANIDEKIECVSNITIQANMTITKPINVKVMNR